MIVGAADPAVALSPLAYMAGLHTVAEYGPAFDGGHKVVKAGLAKIAVKAASARNSPLDADDSGFFPILWAKCRGRSSCSASRCTEITDSVDRERRILNA